MLLEMNLIVASTEVAGTLLVECEMSVDVRLAGRGAGVAHAEAIESLYRAGCAFRAKLAGLLGTSDYSISPSVEDAEDAFIHDTTTSGPSAVCVVHPMGVVVGEKFLPVVIAAFMSDENIDLDTIYIEQALAEAAHWNLATLVPATTLAMARRVEVLPPAPDSCAVDRLQDLVRSKLGCTECSHCSIGPCGTAETEDRTGLQV
jgi:hypothetical protein